MATRFASFATPIGACAIAWSERGVLGVQLPQADAGAVLARLRRRHPGAVQARPDASVQAAIDAIVRLLGGAPQALDAVELDMSGVPELDARVYRAARDVGPGSTITYGELAARLGEPPVSAREVGQALGRNPFAIVVPCHRVLAAGTGLGGFSAPGGVATKRRLLEIENARRGDQPTLFDPVPRAEDAPSTSAASRQAGIAGRGAPD